VGAFGGHVPRYISSVSPGSSTRTRCLPALCARPHASTLSAMPMSGARQFALNEMKPSSCS
jgi:hypothetical protein